MEKRKSEIVILAAGVFPTHPVPLQALREADFVVCCDSAYKQFSIFLPGSTGDTACDRSGANSQFSIPFVVIGDGDSLTEETKQELGDRWIHVAEQDYNDLHKAMQWATSQFSIFNFQFSILGATGKREDHTLGNISYLLTFADEYPGADIEMLTDYGRLCTMQGTRLFDSFPRQQVSLFVMDPANAITSTGLRWPLEEFHARRWWQASLNEVLGTSFTLRSEDWMIVFQTYEAKG